MAASVHPSASHHRPSSLATTSNPDVPEDLLAEILKRVPLKALYRFRCVCRSWNSLLSSPFFSAHHLRFSATETTFFLRVADTLNKNDPPFFTLLDHQDNLITSHEFPLKSHIPFGFMGVVHGVVCFVYVMQPVTLHPDSFRIAFWNPTIRKYIDISFPPDRPFGQFSELKGFGFDASNNDFKLLILNPYVSVATGGFYDVISIREGVWRRNPLPHHLLPCLVVPSYPYRGSSGCFINGNIHWIITSPYTFHVSKSYCLLLFDCEREEFTTMDIPEEVRGLGLPEPRPQLLAYDGSLQLLIFKGSGDSGYFEAWRMDEYGVATSWSKQHNVLPKDQLVKHLVGAIQQFVFKESMLLMDIGKPYYLRP